MRAAAIKKAKARAQNSSATSKPTSRVRAALRVYCGAEEKNESNIG